MDKTERQDALNDIKAMREILGYLYSWAEEKGEEEFARNIDIADVAIIRAKAILEQA